MKQPKDLHIDGKFFIIAQFSPTKGLKIMHRMGRFIGEPLAKLAGGDIGSLMSRDVSPAAFGEAIQTFFERCDEQTFLATVLELLECVTVDGASAAKSFDATFTGNYGMLFKVVGEVLAHNFGDFTGALTAKLGLQAAGAAVSIPAI